MFSPNKAGNSPLSSSFEAPVYQHQHHAKNMQNNYFNNEYQKSMQNKIMKQQLEKQKKKQQLQIYNRKKQEYLDEVAINRYNRAQEKQYMADQYEEMIRLRKMKEMKDKQQQKSFERDLLGHENWIRDVPTQRELVKLKNKSYSHELQQHVQLQQLRKKYEIEHERRVRDKINEQAQQILEKQYQELQQRHKRKSMFEVRQNQLLGINDLSSDIDRGINLQNSGISQDGKLEQITLKKKQQQIYGKGLDHQRHIYQQLKKKNNQQPKYTPHQSYNPITNPLPLIYKNPNVLRMLANR